MSRTRRTLAVTKELKAKTKKATKFERTSQIASFSQSPGMSDSTRLQRVERCGKVRKGGMNTSSGGGLSGWYVFS